MSDPNRLLVVSHPVLALIGRDEIEHAIPAPERTTGWDHVEISPVRAELGRLHELDWAAALAEQERLFAEQLRGEIAGRRRLSYFGFAPIPLALHLGYRVERCIKVDVYQRHHTRLDWAWVPDDSVSATPTLKPQLCLPEHGSKDEGPVVIRVSTSHRIAPAETAEVVASSLGEVDVVLADPGEDALHTRGAVTAVVETFGEALSRVKRMFPNLTAIHLFAAVPVGLAFRLGTQINPTIYKEVITYQYWAKGTPRYRQAIVLAERCRAALSASDLDPAALTEGEVVMGTGMQAVMRLYDAPNRFLDAPKYPWQDGGAYRFYEIMVRAYDSARRASVVLSKCGIERDGINFDQSASAIWHEALDAAARAGLTRKLARAVRTDESIAAYHPELDRIINATHGT